MSYSQKNKFSNLPIMCMYFKGINPLCKKSKNTCLPTFSPSLTPSYFLSYFPFNCCSNILSITFHQQLTSTLNKNATSCKQKKNSQKHICIYKQQLNLKFHFHLYALHFCSLYISYHKSEKINICLSSESNRQQKQKSIHIFGFSKFWSCLAALLSIPLFQFAEEILFKNSRQCFIRHHVSAQ